ncbi:glycosyltransferase [candidate division GN15 bacterium]|nr:glycosyltransferase [candidate division GN15 bacterium]
MTDSPKKKALIISYAFPPSAAVGVYRILKFCKYLPQFGWEPVVLTVEEGHSHSQDPSLFKQLPDDIKIYRSKSPAPLVWYEKKTGKGPAAGVAPASEKAKSSGSSAPPPADTPPPPQSMASRIKGYIRRLIFTPDDNCFWVPYGVSKGMEAIKNEQIDVIFSTSPPASAHLIGYWLSVRSGLPLVIDFRDLWTQNAGYHLKNKPAPARAWDRFLEKRAMKRSSCIVTATDGFTGQVLEKNPYKTPDSVVTITNGLDPDDFASVSFPTEKNDRFTILYLGSLYGARNPYFFFEAMQHWLAQRPEVADKVRVEFVGGGEAYAKATVGTPLESIVRFVGHMPQQQALSKLWQADMLLLLLGFGDTHTTVIPAKLFEYIATGRPILAFVPEGQSAGLIRKYNRGAAVTSPDKDAVAAFLSEQFGHWQERSGPPLSKLDLPEEFDRRTKTRRLAEIFDSVRKSH